MVIVYTVNFGIKGRRKMTAHRLLSDLQIYEVFRVGGVKSAFKDPSFAQSLIIFANKPWQFPK